MRIGSKGAYAAARGIPLDRMYGAVIRRLLRFSTVPMHGRPMVDFDSADRALARAGYWDNPKSFDPLPPVPNAPEEIDQTESCGLTLKEIVGEMLSETEGQIGSLEGELATLELKLATLREVQERSA